MAVVKCPTCRKSLKVSDASAGKRVRCPACQKPFVVPDEAVELEVVEEVEEVEEARAKRITTRPRRNVEDEEEERPRRSRRPVEDEEEERPRRPRRRRPRDDDREDISPSIAPMVYGILSIVFSCGLIGLILGRLAISKADAELDRLPGGKRSRGARKQLQLAKTLGIIGMCLSGVMLVVGVVLTITNR